MTFVSRTAGSPSVWVRSEDRQSDENVAAPSSLKTINPNPITWFIYRYFALISTREQQSTSHQEGNLCLFFFGQASTVAQVSNKLMYDSFEGENLSPNVHVVLSFGGQSQPRPHHRI